MTLLWSQDKLLIFNPGICFLYAWFLEITFVYEVDMVACIPTPKLLINTYVHEINQLNKYCMCKWSIIKHQVLYACNLLFTKSS